MVIPGKRLGTFEPELAAHEISLHEAKAVVAHEPPDAVHLNLREPVRRLVEHLEWTYFVNVLETA